MTRADRALALRALAALWLGPLLGLGAVLALVATSAAGAAQTVAKQCTQPVEGLRFCNDRAITAVESYGSSVRVKTEIDGAAAALLMYVEAGERHDLAQATSREEVEALLRGIHGKQLNIWRSGLKRKTFEVSDVVSVNGWPVVETRAVPTWSLFGKDNTAWVYVSAFVCDAVVLIEQVGDHDKGIGTEVLVRWARSVIAMAQPVDKAPEECVSYG